MILAACVVAVTVATAVTAAPTAADVPPAGLYFEQTTRVVSQDASAGSGVKSRVWHSAHRMRHEAGDTPAGPALVLRHDEGRALRLDPEV